MNLHCLLRASAALLAAGSFVAFPLLAQAAAPNLAEEDIKQLVVMLDATLAGTPRFGAGILAGSDAASLYIATANHIVRQGAAQADGLQVRFRWLPDRPVRATILPQFDSDLDLAIVRVPVAGTEIRLDAMPFEQIADPAKLARGDSLFLLGNPGHRAWRINSTPERFAESSGDLLEFESTFLARGHSGGALLNQNRQIVGMLKSEDPPYGEAIGIRRIADQLRKWNLPAGLGTSQVPQVFSAISVGRHVCALSTTGTAWCWGAIGTFRWSGEKPERGVKIFSLSPRRVRSHLPFRVVSAGVRHTCALTADGAAYCWGSNEFGQLGNGSTEDTLVPVPVSGGLQFRSISASQSCTCAVTTSNDGYCWGDASEILRMVELDGPRVEWKDILEPMPVLRKMKLRFLEPAWHPRAVNTAGEWYGWTGADVYRLKNVPALDVRAASGACILAAAGTVYCATESPAVQPPEKVTFRSLSASERAACAVTTEGAAYCWGTGDEGQLGDGLSKSSATPVRVAGNLSFESVSTGTSHTCGITKEGKIYCWGLLPDSNTDRKVWHAYGPVPVPIAK